MRNPNLILSIRGVKESGYREMAVVNYDGEVLFERPVANGGIRYIKEWLEIRGYRPLPGLGVWVAEKDPATMTSVGAARALESTATLQHNLFEMEKAA